MEQFREGIDIADFVNRTVSLGDFVVVKMDVEGTEYQLLPHLLKSGVLPLIDEMFIEMHTDMNSCCRPPNDQGKHYADAKRILNEYRRAGVYAHVWG